MRAWAMCVLLVGGCASQSLVPCTMQSTCDPLGAFCVDNFCRKPSELMGIDLSVPDDLSTIEPPDLTPMCTDNDGCSGTTPICDAASHTCRACMAGDCAATTAGGLCATSGPLAGSCVACLEEAECSAAQQICNDATGTCVACTASPQCKSGVCDAGKCVLPADIIYVDNKQTPCAGADGTAAKAYCTIATAITNAGAKTHLYVAASATSYDEAVLGMAGPFMIAGAGRNAIPASRIAAPLNTLTAVSIGGTGTYVLEGLDLVGPPGTSVTSIVVFMGSTGTLTIRDSRIRASAAYGVHQLGGTLSIIDSEITGMTGGFPAIYVDGINAVSQHSDAVTLQRNYIHDNNDSVSVDYGVFTIENNLIVNNAKDLFIGTTGAGTFRANTIVNNLGQVTCSAANLVNPLSDSIVIGNKKTGGTQFFGCKLSNIVAGDDTASNVVPLTPVFVSATDFHLAAGDPANAACCIDKATTGPAVDLDGKARPLGAGYDIGAYEAK